MTIEELLRTANGRRRERLLTLGGVEALVDRVRQGEVTMAWVSGGTVADSYDWPAYTTLALAANVGGEIYVGIAGAPAKATSPGRAWRCLQPWGKGDMSGKLTAWTREPNVVKVAELVPGS